LDASPFELRREGGFLFISQPPWRKPGMFSAWWFWAIVAAAVLGMLWYARMLHLKDQGLLAAVVVLVALMVAAVSLGYAGHDLSSEVRPDRVVIERRLAGICFRRLELAKAQLAGAAPLASGDDAAYYYEVCVRTRGGAWHALAEYVNPHIEAQTLADEVADHLGVPRLRAP
jgi:hypothetical protein